MSEDRAITLTDVLRSCMKRDPGEFGSKSISYFFITRYEKSDKEEPYKRLSSRTCAQARVNIQVADEYLRLDYEFETSDSADLKMLWNYLEEFGVLSNRIEEGNEPHFMTLMIQPDEYMGRYSASLTNPIFWAPIPRVVSGGGFSKLRMVFSLKNVGLVDKNNAEETANEETE